MTHKEHFPLEHKELCLDIALHKRLLLQRFPWKSTTFSVSYLRLVFLLLINLTLIFRKYLMVWS